MKFFNTSKDRYLKNIILFIIIGYIFFFSSKLWLPPDKAKVPPTDYGTSIEANDRTVTLISWVYDDDRRMMEVMIEITNKSVDGVNLYNWSAIELNSGILDLSTELEKENFVVIRIEKIPRRFEEISLRMGLNSEDEVNVEGEFSEIKMYATKDSVKKDEIIDGMNERDYRKAACIAKIENYENSISNLNEKIKEEKSVISEAERTISRLEKSKEQQTDSEMASTNSAISEVSGKIDTSNGKIKEYELQIEEYEEKIEIQKEVEQEL